MNGVTSNTTRRIRRGATLPATSSKGEVFIKDSGGSEGMYICLTANSWALLDVNDGDGTVTSVSVTSANGLAGSVANPSTTPAITLSTTITGILKGNGTAISAAVAGTDYATPAALDAKAPLASPTFTGTVTIPTGGQITKPNIIGTATNDSAAAGSVGEFIEGSAAQNSVALVSDTSKTITSISLTAGDWDLSGVVYFRTTATTSITELVTSISLTDNTLDPTVGRYAVTKLAATVPGAGDSSQTTPRVRISLAATTTIYLVGRGSFTASTLQAGGYISARRVR